MVNIDAQPKDEAQELSEVVVVAEAPKANTGAATNYNLDNIQNTPTINRSVYDVAKLNPQASINKSGGISFAGSNNRYNSFQIDGTVSNDVFGLSADGTNGAQTGANPISLESIQEIQVVVSPFDVTQSGFTGGGINAVTKSGTNKFTGTVYAYYNNEGLYGKYSQEKEKESKLDNELTRILGANIGGAIVKDKLFFFVSAENTKKEWSNCISLVPTIRQPMENTTILQLKRQRLFPNNSKRLQGLKKTTILAIWNRAHVTFLHV